MEGRVRAGKEEVSSKPVIAEASWSSSEKLERPDLYVVARFLEILHKNGPMKKTNLHMLLGLNYPRFLEYLEWMEQHGLAMRVTLDDEAGERISLSEKGIESYDTLVEWIKKMMVGLNL
jgi:predicted transcriptional regulator